MYTQTLTFLCYVMRSWSRAGGGGLRRALTLTLIQKAPIEIVCQASRSITAHASPAHALSADNSDSPLPNLRLDEEGPHCL